MVSRFVRKVRTASGAVAVQVVTRQGREVVGVDHLGSAHTDAELELLLVAAQEQLAPGQEVLDVGPVQRAPARVEDVADWTTSSSASADVAAFDAGQLGVSPPAETGVERARGRPVVAGAGGRIVGMSSRLLWRVLTDAYTYLGFDAVADEAFKAMVLARIIEPTSKADTIRVLDEIGVKAPSLRTLFRALQRCQDRDYRDTLAKAATGFSARTTGTASLVLYDCTVRHEALVVRVGVRDHHRGTCRGTVP
ncbi:hypothetical protein F7O44_06225 [Phytoactinopolyspora sp. XMNu-373]|uniref:IS1634 family transposase n=1 Tax=Phytoactinopolyspora mesophila TaxID=2650750 RepID=A0A7K3M069_9ACTN|nr:hypothetical protein [Phytoactinopolyspora mesophila]NDL56664.1 hypothetical protein [Phytoactinopolyspora mesophila]